MKILRSRRGSKKKQPWLKAYQRIDPATEYALLERLMSIAGERGDNEGAIEAMDRLIWERNRALEILALDRLKSHK